MSPPLLVAYFYPLLLLVLGCAPNNPSPSQLKTKEDPIAKAIETRRNQPELLTSLTGALLFLDDTQVRIRPGKRLSAFDSCIDHGCQSAIFLNLPGNRKQKFLKLPMDIAENELGEWASYVHFLPRRLGRADGETIFSIQDSNLFMTASIIYPFYLFAETQNDRQNRVIEEIQQLATQNIQLFKRHNGYNFWKTRPGVTSHYSRVGPSNLPPAMVKKLAKSYLSRRLSPIFNAVTRGLVIPSKDWIRKVLNPDLNPQGADALFNIPNDADDTAIALIIQHLHRDQYNKISSNLYYQDPNNFQVDLPALLNLDNYRDVDRHIEDGRDNWKPQHSGGYLTWLIDENQPTFSAPEQGIIPLGVNNVDPVVNANVLFALSLASQQHTQGFRDALALMITAIEQKVWEKGSLYYPQKMMFPYVISRAFRDGNIGEPGLRNAMKKLLLDVLKEQEQVASKNSRLQGAFPGGMDPTHDLATGLGLCTLLNIGGAIAKEVDQLEAYNRAITSALKYLTTHRKRYRIRNGNTFNRDHRWKSTAKWRGKTWDSGLFFSASFWDLAHWRSRAYTTAIVLEALTKYLLAYDYGQVNIRLGRKIHIKQHAFHADQAEKQFIFDIR